MTSRTRLINDIQTEDIILEAAEAARSSDHAMSAVLVELK